DEASPGLPRKAGDGVAMTGFAPVLINEVSITATALRPSSVTYTRDPSAVTDRALGADESPISIDEMTSLVSVSMTSTRPWNQSAAYARWPTGLIAMSVNTGDEDTELVSTDPTSVNDVASTTSMKPSPAA